MGEAFVTAMQQKKFVLHVQKATEDVDARICTLRDKVSSAHMFFQA